jgi:hypothetical protein
MNGATSVVDQDAGLASTTDVVLLTDPLDVTSAPELTSEQESKTTVTNVKPSTKGPTDIIFTKGVTQIVT